jgi:hypothetical protein
MKKSLCTLKSVIAAVMLFSTASISAQQWDVNGNGGIGSSNYVGTIDSALLYLRTNGNSSNPGQAVLNDVGSFFVESSNNTNFSKAKGSIVAGSGNILGGNANSSLVGGWQNDLSNSGGANIVAGQSNIVTNNASKSVALGWNNTVRNANQFAIGVGVDLTDFYSGGFGIDIAATGNRSFVIGSGSHATAKLTNTVPKSIMFGMSNTSTMLVMDQQVGIRTTAPTANFHTVGTVRLQNLPNGSGKALVVDANGNVMVASSTITKMSDSEEAGLQDQIDVLKNEIKELKELLKQNTMNVDMGISSNEAKLYQNAPNPARGETEIKYYLPKESGDASISIYNLSGQLVKTIPMKEKGNGSIHITGLQGGSYLYQMSIGAKNIDSKKMLIRD